MPSTVPAGIGRKLLEAFRDNADHAVRELAEATLDRARLDAPPSPAPGEDPDPSTSLRMGGRVEKVRPGVYEIIFDEPYAAKQHEAQHFDHPHGGGPKFLEKNIQIAANQLEGKLALSVRSVTSRPNGSVRVSTRKL